MEKKILYLSTYIGKDRFYQEQRNLKFFSIKCRSY